MLTVEGWNTPVPTNSCSNLRARRETAIRRHDARVCATKFPVEENISKQHLRNSDRVLSDGEKPVVLDVRDLRSANASADPRDGMDIAHAPGWFNREDETVQEQPAASAARELKAAARDVVRLGSQWAHNALNWVDERRNNMSNRNRDDREYEERQQAQHNRQQAWPQQQGQYGRPRGNEADDRDMQGNFSSGGYASQQYGANRYGPMPGSMGGSGDESGAYESMHGLRSQEPQGYGMQGYGSQGPQSFGPRSYGAPNTGAGSQGFGPEGYGTSIYEGRGGYESQSFVSQGAPGYGQGGGSREFGSQGPYRQYGLQGQDISGRDIGSSGLSRRHLQGESFGREFGRDSQQQTGQQWRNPLEERSHLGYGQPGYGSQSLSSQQHLYGQQGQQGFESGMRTSHRGLGPKNYTRSDERIREDLNERLTDADDIDARGLNVEVSNGIATLTGTVEQRWMKHRAEDLAESCSGVRDVNNQIRVQSLHEETLRQGTGTTAGPGSAKSSSALGSGSGTASTPTASGSSSSIGSAGSTTSSGSSSTRPGGSAGAGH